MKEYKLAKGWAIAIYIFAPLLIALFASFLIMPFIPGMLDDLPANAYWFIVPLSIGMIGLMVAGIIDAAKGKFVIDSDKIYSVSVFSNRQLMFNEIKGYTINDKYIFVESNVKGKKKVKISIYYSKTDEIIGWLGSNYPDLDQLVGEQEQKDILNNEDFGYTTAEREEKLAKARKTAKIINWAGGLIAAWTLFYPNPYEYAIIASIAVPVISIFILKRFGGLIRIDEKKNSAYPSVFIAFFFSSIAVLCRALFDYNILNHDHVWMPSILIALAFVASILIGNKEFSFRDAKGIATNLFLSILAFGYGYGVVITLNTTFDQSQPQTFNAKILNKRINSGKSTSYYFELSPWGQQKEVDEISVSKDLYDKLGKDDKVNIFFKEGRFEIPWFIVTE